VIIPGTPADPRFQLYPIAVSDSGFAVGVSPINDASQNTVPSPVRATIAGGFSAMEMLPSAHSCEPYDVDNAGLSVGNCWMSFGGLPVPVRGDAGGRVSPLALDVPEEVRNLTVRALNDQGVLVAAGSTLEERPGGPPISRTRGFLLTPIPAEAMVSLTVNQSAFQPGQTLQATITTQDAAGLDLYVGAILPDGDQLLLLTTLSPVQGQVVRLSTTNPTVFPKVAAGPRPTQVFSYTFTGLETPGMYHLVTALVPPGAFQDGIIHGKDLVGFDWKAISLQVTPLHAKMLAIRDRHLSP
jgi:hypothetical protein